MIPATPNPPLMPEWAQSLSEKYYSRTLSMFVLYGNVHDLVPLDRGGAVEYVPLLSFLNQALFGRRDLVLTYDRGGGLSFARQEMQTDFRNALAGYDSFHQTNYAQALPRTPDGVLKCRRSRPLAKTGAGRSRTPPPRESRPGSAGPEPWTSPWSPRSEGAGRPERRSVSGARDGAGRWLSWLQICRALAGLFWGGI